MKTAKEVKAETEARLIIIAKEFILNNTGIPIQDAINNGYFSATVSFDGVPNPEKAGAEVVKLFEEQGFEAEHVYYEGPNGHENYIYINWEEA